jgi:sulfide dehydrogenase cytochrome subunit
MTMNWAFTVLLFALTGPALAGKLDPLVALCDGCHGSAGVSQWTDMPTIAGISELVHADALFAYKDGARPCETSEFRIGNTSRPATDMCAVTNHMTETQIQALASFYAAKPFVPAKQEFDATLAAQGAKVHKQACERCHSGDGRVPADDASILKGQWMGYLRQTFAEYAAGTREQPDNMKLTMDPLSDDDVEALIHFYAGQD